MWSSFLKKGVCFMKLSLEVKVVFVEDLKLCFTETSPKHENSITTKKMSRFMVYTCCG